MLRPVDPSFVFVLDVSGSMGPFAALLNPNGYYFFYCSKIFTNMTGQGHGGPAVEGPTICQEVSPMGGQRWSQDWHCGFLVSSYITS